MLDRTIGEHVTLYVYESMYMNQYITLVNDDIIFYKYNFFFSPKYTTFYVSNS